MLSEREKQICARLRLFREILQIPRTRFALDVGVGSDKLASYEAGRARLRYGVFVLIHRRHSINPVWLATGAEVPIRGDFSEAAVSLQISPRTPFTEAYDKELFKLLVLDVASKPGSNLEMLAKLHDEGFLGRLKQARVSSHITLEMVAKELRVKSGAKEVYDPNFLERVESGETNLSVSEMVAWQQFLIETANIRRDWLLSGVGEMIDFTRRPKPGTTIHVPINLRETVKELRVAALELFRGIGILEQRMAEKDQQEAIDAIKAHPRGRASAENTEGG